MDEAYTWEIGQTGQPCLGISMDEEVRSEWIWPRMNHWAFGYLCNSATWMLYFPFVWLDSCPMSSGCYHTSAPRTAVRPEFHLMVKFQTDTCPKSCYHTLWYGNALFNIYWDYGQTRRKKGDKGEAALFYPRYFIFNQWLVQVAQNKSPTLLLHEPIGILVRVWPRRLADPFPEECSQPLPSPA